MLDFLFHFELLLKMKYVKRKGLIMTKYIALLGLGLLFPFYGNALTIYTPFYDSYQKAQVSGAPVPQGKYRTGWRAGRYRAHWHDTHREYLRQEK